VQVEVKTFYEKSGAIVVGEADAKLRIFLLDGQMSSNKLDGVWSLASGMASLGELIYH
jgi:hypothetical protein